MPDIIGQIYSGSEANTNYGAVLSSIEFDSAEVLSLCEQTNNYIMFNIKDEKLFIIGDNRAPIYPAGFAVDASEVYVVYSKSIVIELLDSGKAKVTTFEKRNNVLTITNGSLTLETGNWCPPLCY